MCAPRTVRSPETQGVTVSKILGAETPADTGHVSKAHLQPFLRSTGTTLHEFPHLRKPGQLFVLCHLPFLGSTLTSWQIISFTCNHQLATPLSEVQRCMFFNTEPVPMAAEVFSF